LPGEHGAEILRDLLGWDEAKIRALAASGVLVGEARINQGD
jgi:hypothetical protein